MEININKNIYAYGKFYDEARVNPITMNEYCDVIVYAQPLFGITKTIGSLEGFFISEIPLIKEGDKGVRKDWQPVFVRNQMKDFEEKYRGKFHPFEKK